MSSWLCRVAVAAELSAAAVAVAQSRANSNGASAIKSACAPNGSIPCANASNVRGSRRIEGGSPRIQRTDALELCNELITRRAGRVTPPANLASVYHQLL